MTIKGPNAKFQLFIVIKLVSKQKQQLISSLKPKETAQPHP